jgi:hypothetical protein
MNKGQEMNEERINIWGFLCREDRMSFFNYLLTKNVYPKNLPKRRRGIDEENHRSKCFCAFNF